MNILPAVLGAIANRRRPPAGPLISETFSAEETIAQILARAPEIAPGGTSFEIEVNDVDAVATGGSLFMGTGIGPGEVRIVPTVYLTWPVTVLETRVRRLSADVADSSICSMFIEEPNGDPGSFFVRAEVGIDADDLLYASLAVSDPTENDDFDSSFAVPITYDDGDWVKVRVELDAAEQRLYVADVLRATTNLDTSAFNGNSYPLVFRVLAGNREQYVDYMTLYGAGTADPQ